MGALFERIKGAVLENRYLIGAHAANSLDDRGIPEWQVVEGISSGWLMRERPQDAPNPSVEVQQVLPDGTPIKAVWAWLAYHSAAKLVTVHFFDR